MEMGSRALVWGLLTVSVVAGCVPVQFEDRPQTDPVIARYTYGDATRNPITWEGARSRALSFAKYMGILGSSATPLYVRLIEHQQPAGATVKHAHFGEIVYVLSGEQELDQTAGSASGIQKVRVTPGTAKEVFVYSPSTHVHSNVGSVPNIWISAAVGVLNDSTSSELLFPSDRLLYATPRLDGIGGHVGYGHVLQRVEVDPGGRTAIHRPTTLLVLYVLEGTALIRHANGTAEKLTVGEGTYVWASDAVQVAGVDGRSTALLEYFLTYFGEAVFQEDLRDWPKT
jgi:quercetin dioxygenase-like cupin family protein